MRSPEEIMALLRERRRDRQYRLEMMRRIRDIYQGDLVVPVPEIDQMNAPAVANLMQLGVDGISQRIASTMPDARFPAIGQNSDRARNLARQRRDCVHGWWKLNRLDLQMGKRARHFVSYASIVVQLRPHPLLKIPEYRVRDPLATLAAEPYGEELIPEDAIFLWTRSARFLADMYGRQPIQQLLGTDFRPDDQVELVEYVDADQCTLIAAGRYDQSIDRPYPQLIQADRYSPTPAEIVLEHIPNRLGICPVVQVGRVGLDRGVGQFDGMSGMYYQQALLMALEVVAVKKGVFADTWLVSQDGNARIVREADGLQGITGVIKGGDIKQIQTQPGYRTTETIDRFERAMRVQSRIPAEDGGESATNIRTGRRGDQVLSAVVDMPVQEAQRALGRSLEAENKLAIAIDKAYFNYPKSVWVSWQSNDKEVTYTPENLWVSDRHEVSYAAPGTDVNGLTIALGQRIGMGTISKRTSMELDPLVEDPERELKAVTGEALELALQTGIQQQASGGQLPVSDLARIIQLVRDEDKDLADAVQQAQQEAQARQAQQVPPEAPQAQPGLAQPGQGAEASIANVDQTQPGTANLAALMGALRLPNRFSAPERQLAAPGPGAQG